ncbi:histidine phosphotransferase family protein [Cognatiyoonia sp.]|uniref:histidine phosphotransferase family protein n=1 Tax=Cognatiyoonia sp. TaxID=2211652 RepID=UPI003F697860
MVARQEAQTLFLLLQCLETHLPFGGSVVIAHANQTWTITAEGESVTDDLTFWEQIKQQQTVLTQASNQVKFALLQ